MSEYCFRMHIFTGFYWLSLSVSLYLSWSVLWMLLYVENGIGSKWRGNSSLLDIGCNVEAGRPQGKDAVLIIMDNRLYSGGEDFLQTDIVTCPPDLHNWMDNCSSTQLGHEWTDQVLPFCHFAILPVCRLAFFCCCFCCFPIKDYSRKIAGCCSSHTWNSSN